MIEMTDMAIGDLSKEDRLLLRDLARLNRNILEVGVGASTQILTHYTPGKVVSYDTDTRWIDRIRDVVFPKVGVDGECEFRQLGHDLYMAGAYDFAFIDCAREYRVPCADNAWTLLDEGGSIAFHDTRRARDMFNVSAFIVNHFPEIGRIECNYKNSNITVVWKRFGYAEFVNWHTGMTDEQLGIEWL